MRKSLVVKFHDLDGHFAVDQTVEKIVERYYLLRMKKYIKYHISIRSECAIHKKLHGKQAGMLHSISRGQRPFETINIDHLGPFPLSMKNNTYILILVGNMITFVKLYPSKTVQARVVVN